MSSRDEELLTIHVNVQITAASLQSIVAHAKRLAGRMENGMIRVDTAEFVAAMISQFLMDKDFDSYVRDESHYSRLPGGDADSGV